MMNPIERYVAVLDELDGRTITVTRATQRVDHAALARDVAREFNKPGGPKIRQRAIDKR
jgi:hypothetical protein